jgi:hypothetical protein
MAFICRTMIAARGIYATLCSHAACIMARLVSFGISPCKRSEGLPPSRRNYHQVGTEVIFFVFLQHWSNPAPPRSPAHMKERPRGKPKRGSPWKPRRPPISPLASPATGSSSLPQSNSPAATPPPLQSLHSRSPPSQPAILHSMASIPRGSTPAPRSPQDPRMHFMATMSFPRSSSTWRSAPAAFGEFKRARLHPAGHLDSENFKERLGILYDLVFELRREMADLKFRLQATEDNVATFLHILTTMQEELASGPAGSSPGEAPDMAMDSTRRQAVDTPDGVSNRLSWQEADEGTGRRGMRGMCHSQSPHLVFNRVNVDMSCIYAGVLSLQVQMRWVIMAKVNISMLIVGLILPKPDCHPALLLWCERDPILPRCSSTFALPAIRIDCYMTRPRGRPRRGAPWKPRRPSLSPPDTSSDDSPPRLQSVSSPVNLQPPHFGSMAIIPNTSITLLRLLHDPGPSQTPASNFGRGQAYQR